MVSNRAQTQDKSNLVIPLVIVCAVLPIAGAGWWWLSREPVKAPPPPITVEAKEYVRNGYLALSGVEMKATTNMTGAPLVEITGNLTNKGNRTLTRVELSCVFYNNMGQIALRERLAIVKRPLRPGEATSFRLPFEGIPESWNLQMPQLVIAGITFGS